MARPQRIDPKRNRFMFAIGTSGRDLFYTLYSGYLLAFILYTKHLSVAEFALVTVIMVCCRAFDAIIDPFVGGLIENTHSKYGRFKPWIVIGGLSAAVVLFLIFSVPLDGWKFLVFLAFANVALAATYSLNDIAYWGMLPALTSDQTERTKLTSLACFTGSIGSAAAFVLIPMLTNGQNAIGGSAAIAFPVIAVIATAAMLGTQLFTLFGAHEPEFAVKNAEKAPRLKFKDIIRVVVTNDQLLWACLGLICQSIAGGLLSSTLSQLFIYTRFKYDGFLYTVSMVGVAAGGVLANILLDKLHIRFGRKRVVKFCTLLFIFGNAVVLTAGLVLPRGGGWDTALFVTYILGLLFAGFGSNAFYMTMLVSVSNTVEYNELRTGNRQEGLIYSVRPLFLQTASAIVSGAVAAILLALGLTNVTNQISDWENEVKRGELTEIVKLEKISELLQSVDTSSLNYLLVAITVIPTMLLVIGYLVYRKKYFIDEEYYENMKKEIIAKGEEIA
ncbi:MAG: MFS transporter [Clostridium sp.]|jgi:melibiose permease/lactose/raffinose/galactose permease|nr:MFS transporter [Clostridium sp.]